VLFQPCSWFATRRAQFLTLTLRRKIAAEREPFKTVGQKDASQIRVPFETNSEKVENLALQPVSAWPNGHQRVDDWVLRANTGAKAQAIAARDGNETIVQLEARLDGKAVHTGGIAEEIEVQSGIFLALLSRGKEKVVGYNDSSLPTVFDHLSDRLWIPGAELFDYNTSVCIRKLRHVIEIP
jgi:hypothetical protein